MLKVIQTALWRKFEVTKRQKELGAFERNLKRACTSSSASNASQLPWKVHFSISRINLLHIIGEISLAKSELEALRQLVLSWSICKTYGDLERNGFFKRLLLFISILKVLNSLHEGTEEAFSLLSHSKLQLASTPDCHPMIPRLLSLIEASAHTHRYEFIKASKLTTPRDSLNSALHDVCKRYTGSFEPIDTVGGESTLDTRGLALNLACEENLFAAHLCRLRLADCASSLLRYRSLLKKCGRHHRGSIFKRQSDVYRSMSKILLAVLTSSRNSSESPLIGCDLFLSPNLHGSGGEDPACDSSPASSLALLQSLYLQNANQSYHDIEYVETSNHERWGVLSVELWIWILSADRCYNALSAASKVGNASAEYAAIKMLLQRLPQHGAGTSKVSPDFLLARKTHLEQFFLDQVAHAKLLLQ